MTRRAILLATAASLLGLATLAPAQAQEFKAGGITVVKPWARATPGASKVGAAYFEIKAAAGAGDKLVSASSPVAGTVELHTHIHEKGVMQMRRVDDIPVPAGKSVTFQPSGLHVMLIDLKKPLKQGDSFEMTLKFEKAGEVKVTTSVAAVGAAGPAGMSGMGGMSGAGAHKH